MSDRIQELVEEIRGKSSDLKRQLESTRSRNSELESELSELRNSISDKEKELEELKSKYDDLQKQDLNNDTGVSVSAEQSISNEAIDELVKEIEYCIEQLKK